MVGFIGGGNRSKGKGLTVYRLLQITDNILFLYNHLHSLILMGLLSSDTALDQLDTLCSPQTPCQQNVPS